MAASGFKPELFRHARHLIKKEYFPKRSVLKFQNKWVNKTEANRTFLCALLVLISNTFACLTATYASSSNCEYVHMLYHLLLLNDYLNLIS